MSLDGTDTYGNAPELGSEAVDSSPDGRTDNNLSSVRTPDNLTIAIYPDHKSTTPTSKIISWANLVHSLSEHRVSCTLATCLGEQGQDCPGKFSQAWSPVVIEGTRLDVNVRMVTAIVVDLDSVPDLAYVDRLTAEGIASVVHSTHSHRDDDQRYRLVVPISRPLTPTEYRRARAAVISHYLIPGDPSCADLSRLYFTPAAPSDAPRYVRVTEGAALDVDRFLAMAPPAVESAPSMTVRDPDIRIPSGGRNTEMTRIAGTWRARGFDEVRILAMLRIDNAERCDPPLDDSELVSIARSIAKKPTTVDPSSSGLVDQIAERMGLDRPVADDVYGVDAAEWLGVEFGDDPWIVHGLIPEGVPIILAGQPKAGKSWIELYTALCIATGRPVFGRPTTRAKVLVISREDGNRECKRRIELLMRGMGIDREELRGWFHIDCTKPLYFDRPEDVARLERTLETYRPKFVAIDSLSRIHMRDENSRSEMALITNTWNDLCGHYNVSVMLLHHVVKVGDGKSLIQKIRGSGDIVATARMLIGAEKKKDGSIVIETDGNMGDMAHDFCVRRVDYDSAGAKVVIEGAARYAIKFEFAGSGAVVTADSLSTPLIGELVDQLERARHDFRVRPGVVTQTDLRKGRGSKDKVDAALDTMVVGGIAELVRCEGGQVVRCEKDQIPVGYRLTAAGIALVEKGNAKRTEDQGMPTTEDLMRIAGTPVH